MVDKKRIDHIFLIPKYMQDGGTIVRDFKILKTRSYVILHSYSYGFTERY